MNEPALKAQLIEAREKAKAILGESHIGFDVKDAINCLLVICDSYQSLIEDAAGQSADTRVIKRKLELANSEARKKEERLNESRKMLLSLASEIEMVNVEAKQIAHRRRTIPANEDTDSAKRIQGSAERIISVVTQLVKSNFDAIKESKSS